MPRKAVQELLDIFRNSFASDTPAEVPLSLRQEPRGVVYRALMDEDQPSSAPLSPIMEFAQNVPLGGDPLGDIAAKYGPAVQAAAGVQAPQQGIVSPEQAPSMQMPDDLTKLLGG